jgi:hypothetical protein
VTCPYAEPDCASDIASDAPRCLCGRVLKRCSQCEARNRAFANFCRACGAVLIASRTNWSGYRGGPRRLGTNPTSPGSPCIVDGTDLELRLGDPCRSLLGYDGHLIAVSLAGVIEIADPLRGKSVCRFLAQGPITAEPCIGRGVLYLATRGQVTAYSLAAMIMETPRTRPLWQLPLNGTPIHALTAVGDSLYVTLASSSWREVQVIGGLDQRQPAVARAVHGASRVSWLAADPSRAQAVFLSEGDAGGGIQLHVCDPALITHSVALRGLTDHPIALIDGTVFGVFGDTHRLYRIDASSGSIEEPLEDDTQFFALAQAVDNSWDRDGVWISTGGIFFSRSGVRDTFEPHERAVKGSPLIVRDCAAIVGLEDGRVRVYDLSQLPRHEVWYVGGSRSNAAITALASFDAYIAAGNRDGVVEVRELRAREAAR